MSTSFLHVPKGFNEEAKLAPEGWEPEVLELSRVFGYKVGPTYRWCCKLSGISTADVDWKFHGNIFSLYVWEYKNYSWARELKANVVFPVDADVRAVSSEIKNDFIHFCCPKIASHSNWVVSDLVVLSSGSPNLDKGA